MSRIYPFTHINLGSGWLIKVDPDLSLARPGIICTGTSGLFETGTAQNSGVERQYADGRVLPSINILQGKTFTLTLIFYGSPISVYTTLEQFQSYVMKNQFTVSNGMGSIDSCIGQQVRVEEELYSEDKMYMTVSVEVASENSFFNFLF